jgi:hypothetical protein
MLACVAAAAFSIAPVPGIVPVEHVLTKDGKEPALDRWHYDIGAPLVTTPVLK